jgi:N-acetylmuramic acid 6-phosphate etherase
VSGFAPGADRGHLLTEQANPLSERLDQLPTDQLVALFIANDLEPQRALEQAAPALTAAVDAIAARLAAGGRLFYLGAGSSALEERGFGPGDGLVGIAAGGTTPYVLGGLEHARSIGALAIALACVSADQVPMPCDIDIRLLTGPELVAGSTRLKAGTATKMALNLLSTGVMVRLGKVHGNRMVDVAVTNAKLEDRALRILRDLAGVNRERGHALLQQSGGSVKLALLMAASGMELAEARAHLTRHGPRLRAALEACGAQLPGLAQPQGPQ